MDLLRRRDGNGLLLIDLELQPDGGIRLGWFDTGPAADRARGGDVERDLLIAPGDVAQLCFALLAERLDGQADALDQLRALCARSGVAVSESGWN